MRKEQPNQTAAISTARKTAISGVVIALYIAVMFLTQGFAFGQYQMRLATSLYALAAVYPFLIMPLGVANALSNTVMGGLGIFDILGGFGVGLATALACCMIRRVSVGLTGIPILLIPTLLVPLWLSVILQVPYIALVASVGVGQIAPAIIGALLVKYFEKPLVKSAWR